MDNSQKSSTIHLTYRGRFEQIPIYFMKIVRGYIYQNDWIALPLSAVVAAMISIVIRGSFAVNMSGTLKGAFALTCVAIWNGCFNSIQSVCRERGIVKREHRSGMHASSYLIAHMLFQALVCLLQSVLTMFVLYEAKVKLSGPGLMTSRLLFDIGITMFIITFSADMLALMISCIVKTTTAAMTVVPFLLIFQLVFSGGIFTNLPKWTGNISDLTLSKPGLDCIAAQAHYNDLPMSLGWQMIEAMKDDVVIKKKTLSDVMEEVGALGYADQIPKEELEKEISGQLTVDDILEIIGRDKARQIIEEKMAASSVRPDFDSTKENVIYCWFMLLFYAMLYLLVSLISLKFIDKDKR